MLSSRLTNAICQIVLAEDVLSGLRAPEVAVTEVPQRASNKFAGVAICKLPPLSLSPPLRYEFDVPSRLGEMDESRKELYSSAFVLAILQRMSCRVCQLWR